MYPIVILSFVDFVDRFIEPASLTTQFSGVSGPCTIRSDSAYVLSGNSPGVAVLAADIGNRLSGSFCIGLLVNPANVMPVVTFYNSSFMADGEITVTSNTVSFSIGESSVEFTVVNTIGFKRFQLCADGSTMTLYDDCVFLESQPFTSGGLTDGKIIGLLRDLTDFTMERFLVNINILATTSMLIIIIIASFPCSPSFRAIIPHMNFDP